MNGRRRVALAAAGGAVLALGAPPLRVWAATFVAMALLGASVDGARPRPAALAGWAFGTVATLGSFYWIVGTVNRFAGLPLALAVLAYVLLSALTGLALGGAAWLGAMCSPVFGTPWGLALGIVVAERYVPGIFHWQIAAPLVFAPFVPQGADLIGVSGIGAVLLAVMTVAARWLRWGSARALRRDGPRPSIREGSVALALFVALWGYGFVRTRAVLDAMRVAPRVRVALVQPDIDARGRWEDANLDEILISLHEQTTAALSSGAELVVWPEAAYPFVLPHAPGIDGVGAPPVFPVPAPVPIVFGAVTQDAEGRKYNSALVREPDGGISMPVDKRQLVPFGEYIPVVGWIPWVRRTFARADGLAAGTRPTVLHTGSGLALGVLNCFEDTFASMGADVGRSDLLLNVTNDAWFGDGAAPYAHLMLAQWRAIETRRELLRAVNTGVTCRVNALGVVEDTAMLGRKEVLLTMARRMSLRPPSPFVIDYAPPAGLVAAAIAAALSVRRARRARGVS